MQYTQIHETLIFKVCKARDYFKGENVKLFQSLIFDALKFKVCLIKMMTKDWCSWGPGITISIHLRSSFMCINISTDFLLLGWQNWRMFVKTIELLILLINNGDWCTYYINTFKNALKHHFLDMYSGTLSREKQFYEFWLYSGFNIYIFRRKFSVGDVIMSNLQHLTSIT